MPSYVETGYWDAGYAEGDSTGQTTATGGGIPIRKRAYKAEQKRRKKRQEDEQEFDRLIRAAYAKATGHEPTPDQVEAIVSPAKAPTPINPQAAKAIAAHLVTHADEAGTYYAQMSAIIARLERMVAEAERAAQIEEEALIMLLLI